MSLEIEHLLVTCRRCMNATNLLWCHVLSGICLSSFWPIPPVHIYWLPYSVVAVRYICSFCVQTSYRCLSLTDQLSLSAALTKSVGLRTDVRIDERSYWLSRVASLSASLAIPLVYPRMFAIHNLQLKVFFHHFQFCLNSAGC